MKRFWGTQTCGRVIALRHRQIKQTDLRQRSQGTHYGELS
jgi:hypothetical protein